MTDDKNKKANELGKDELGEVSGGTGIGDLIKKPFPIEAYGCPIPKRPKIDKKDEKINNELTPLPDNSEQNSNK